MNAINYPKTLRQGDKGTEVMWLQYLLNSGSDTLLVDGSYGPNTVNAVKRVQTATNQKDDGVCGPKTWTELLPKIVSYKQMDPKWKDVPYSSSGDDSQTIGNSGCGPACGAIIVASWRDPSVTPVEACADALANGFRTKGSGTSAAFFEWYAKKYGLKCRSSSSMEQVCQALQAGFLVVDNVGPGQFTKGGHYIVLWTYDPFSKVIYVADVGSSRAERTRADQARLTKESKRFYIFEQ